MPARTAEHVKKLRSRGAHQPRKRNEAGTGGHRAKRVDEQKGEDSNLEVVVFEKGPLVADGPCVLRYDIKGEIQIPSKTAGASFSLEFPQ